MSTDIISTLGRLVAAVGPGIVGEVMLPANTGGSDAYIAQSADPKLSIARGATVQVMAFFPPRTVLVKEV